MPKVSVVILTFNRAKFLAQAIRSVLDQTYQDFEIIVVDDCSTDGTKQTVRNFFDKRIKYLRHEFNKGEGAGRNDGIRIATGEYIAFLDDDDEWLPEKLRLQVECLDQASVEVGAVHCGRTDIDSKSGAVLGARGNEERGEIYWQLLKGNFLTVSTMMLRAKCFELVGDFDESISFGLDYDMWIRVSQQFRFECINQPLVKYAIHEGTLSNNVGLIISGIEAWLWKYDQVVRQNPAEYNRRYCGLGLLYCLNGNTQKGRAIVLDAIKKYPKNLKGYAILCATFLGPVGFRKLANVWRKRPNGSVYMREVH